MMTPVTAQSVGFTNVTSYYSVSGEICYSDFGFVETYSVGGEMRVDLNKITNVVVNYDYSLLIHNLDADSIYQEGAGSGTLVNRLDLDMNYTLFFVSVQTPRTQFLPITNASVEVVRQGVRYVEVNGQHVKALYFCYSLTEMQNILRFEWYYEWNSGILLQFVKSIDINFLRVQWLDYRLKNTTLILTGEHPITVFFTNNQENFYAIVGAAIIVVILFYYLILQKVEPEEKA